MLLAEKEMPVVNEIKVANKRQQQSMQLAKDNLYILELKMEQDELTRVSNARFTTDGTNTSSSVPYAPTC